MPPSRFTLQAVLDAGSASGPNADIDAKYKAGHAALNLAEYGLTGITTEPQEAWDYLEQAVVIGKSLKYYQLISDAMKDQVDMLKYFEPEGSNYTNMQLCDKMLQSAERHQDMYLLALTTYVKGCITAQAELPGCEALFETSKQFWLDMMKACRLRVRCGLPGVRMAGERLICVFLDWSNELMATSRCEHAQAEAVLLEAQPYLELTNDPKQKMRVLMGLANNCELQASDSNSSLRERAAEYRQQMFVEMINQELDVPHLCSVCEEDLNAHKPSEANHWSECKVLVAPCCHLYHKECLQELHESDECQTCAHPLGLCSRTLQGL